MRKFFYFKLVQLLFYIIATVLFFVLTYFNTDFLATLKASPEYKFMYGVTCILLAFAYLFLFLDITMETHRTEHFNKFSQKAYNDPVANIASRNSMDEALDRYRGEELPNSICIIIFHLTSLVRVNDRESHTGGDKQIRNFSVMLSNASSIAEESIKVGRNGGNTFIVLFEGQKKAVFSDFLDRMESLVKNYNERHPNGWIRYKFGLAYNLTEQADDIGHLVSIAAKKAETAEIRPDENGNFPVYKHYK